MVTGLKLKKVNKKCLECGLKLGNNIEYKVFSSGKIRNRVSNCKCDLKGASKCACCKEILKY